VIDSEWRTGTGSHFRRATNTAVVMNDPHCQDCSDYSRTRIIR
jgi:hypothetical protein